MKEINYKDMKFNPFRSALPLRSSKNLIGGELTNEASAEGKLASTMPCKEEVGDSQWMLYTDRETDYLKSRCKRMAEVIESVGHINRKADDDLFSSVVHHIIGQQISTRAQQTIWQRMQEIPYGQTVTYGQLAQTLGCKSAQAVGGAVGHNPLTLIVPCHRVVGTGGSLTGYAGGIDKKVRLLQMEGAMTHDLFIPTRGTAL